ncbi:MAG: 4-hydroxy-tetrahydrodipicolinate synthase [Clostridia bacterium]|nr:4-hydroxy-tetrahydrodipicolinate synthase [Clostridia bacterium]
MSLHKPTVFTGAATALITPFKDGEIDYGAVENLIEMQISGGISAILVAGTTGEGSTLTAEEYYALVKFAKERIRGRVPLLAGCGANSTARAIALTEAVCTGGADALLAVTPYYNKTNDKGILLHYRAIADAATRPLMLYNVPSRTGFSMTMHHYRELASHPNVVAVKEASGDLGLLEALVTECGDRLDVYTGNDNQTVAAYKLGAKGVISVYSNLYPRAMADICRYAARGEWKQAEGRLRSALSCMQALFREVNPIPVKFVAAGRGLCQPEYRLPLCPPTPETARHLQTVFGQS